MQTERFAATFGGSEFEMTSPEYQDGIKLGAFLATKGFVVKNGGYYGLMEAVSRGVVETKGKVIGILNQQFGEKLPNKYVTDVIIQADVFDRLRSLSSNAEVFIFQHGSIGTLEELMAVWCLRYTLTLQDVRICLIGQRWKHLLAALQKLHIKKKEFKYFELFADVNEFVAKFDQTPVPYYADDALEEQIIIRKEFSQLKIFIDGKLHVYIDKERLLGIQSWISNDKYIIEYTLTGNTVTTEYNSPAKWEYVLHLLDENL